MRITTNETGNAIAIKLDGRVAGPWAAELDRVWAEMAPRLRARKLTLDLRNVTFADVIGMRVLNNIYSQTGAELIAGTLWTQYLADEICGKGSNRMDEEAGNAIDE